MLPEYSVRQLNESTFSVAKFGWHKWPEVVYFIKEFSSGEYFCSCPAQTNCKHKRMVGEYLNLGCPIMNCFWIDDTGGLNACYANITDEWRKELERNGGDRHRTHRLGHGTEGRGRVRKAKR